MSRCFCIKQIQSVSISAPLPFHLKTYRVEPAMDVFLSLMGFPLKSEGGGGLQLENQPTLSLSKLLKNNHQ